MKESKIEKREMRRSEEIWREDRPLNTSDGREVRRLAPRPMEEGKVGRG